MVRLTEVSPPAAPLTTGTSLAWSVVSTVTATSWLQALGTPPVMLRRR